MGNFVKLTTRTPENNYLFQWVQADTIKSLSQMTGSQDGTNEGTCVFDDGSEIALINFNETIQSLG